MRRFIFRRFAKWAIVAVASVFVFACGESPTAVVKPPPVDTTPKPPQFVSARVVGPATIVAGTTPSVGLVGVYPDGSTAPLSGGKFSTSKYDVADVMVGGIIVPARLGNFEVRATYPGLTVTPLSVEVVGTPWSQTPTVDPEVQKWAKIPGNMLSPEGRFSRWADGAVLKFYNSGFLPQKYFDAIPVFWGPETPTLRYTTVSDSSEANVMIRNDPTLTRCMEASASWSNQPGAVFGVIVRGVIYVNLSKCGDTEESRIETLVHEVGHVLGIGGHTPAPEQASQRDVMSEVNPVFQMSPFLGDVMRWWRGVKPGSILVPG